MELSVISTPARLNNLTLYVGVKTMKAAGKMIPLHEGWMILFNPVWVRSKFRDAIIVHEVTHLREEMRAWTGDQGTNEESAYSTTWLFESIRSYLQGWHPDGWRRERISIDEKCPAFAANSTMHIYAMPGAGKTYMMYYSYPDIKFLDSDWFIEDELDSSSGISKIWFNHANPDRKILERFSCKYAALAAYSDVALVTNLQVGKPDFAFLLSDDDCKRRMLARCQNSQERAVVETIDTKGWYSSARKWALANANKVVTLKPGETICSYFGLPSKPVAPAALRKAQQQIKKYFQQIGMLIG